ncbi:uncharacterized protein [Rutidosis leptorrhynchoides]|uniref:uncharacterized protein n=1 Tax=Rutidosis leptorrhynchoides TaxID=125765 RepID=UPI003A99ABDD
MEGRFDNFIDGKGEQTKYLWESFLNGPKISLHPDTGEVLKPYELQGEEAKRAQADIDSRSIIMQALPHDMYKSVSSLKSKELLDEITRQQEGYSQSEQTKLDIALVMYEDYFQKPDEPLKDCYRRFCEVINELKKVGVKKENQELNMKFLKKLNATWTPYGNNFRASKNTKKYNIHEVLHQNPSNRSNSLKTKQTISSDEDTYSDVDEEHQDLVKAAAMFSKELNLRRSSGGFKKNNNDRTSSSFSYYKKSETPTTQYRAPDSKDPDNVCFNYGKTGHFARECRLPKRKDAEYYKKKMLLAQDAEKGKVLKASDDVWLNWSDSEQEPERANVVKLTNMNHAPDSVSSDDEEEVQLYTDIIHEYYNSVNNSSECVFDVLQATSKRPNDPSIQINVPIRNEPASHNPDKKLPELPDMYIDNFAKMKLQTHLRKFEEKLYRTEQSKVVLAGHISNQTLFMNCPKDSFRENKGLGFENPLTLSKMAKAEPCLYDSKYLMIDLPARLTFASNSEIASQATTFCEMISKSKAPQGPSPCHPIEPSNVLADSLGKEIVDLKLELKGYKKHVSLIEKDNIDLQVKV